MTLSLLDKYTHLGLIGGGYFAIVKRYEDAANGRKVAVKELKSEYKTNVDYINRFKREVRLLQELAGHSNIIELIDAEITETDFRYIMPLATDNLEKFINQHNTTLDVGSRLKIFDQVLGAVKFAHSKNILHRDLNPNNILVFVENEEPVVKVSDFGLGKSLESLSAQTNSHTVGYGQFLYTAPEQYDQLNQATAKSDIYSLGRVLDFVLTGRLPRIVQASDFATVVRKAVEDSPDRRHENIAEFEEEYEHIKGLLMVSQTSSVDNLKDYSLRDQPIDWHQFHRLALKPANDTDEHIYYAYIEPIIDLLSQNQNLRNYHEVVSSSFQDFMTEFAKNLKICSRSTGWPFDSVASFVSFYKLVFDMNASDEINLLCLTELWEFAYEGDRWKAQDVVRDIFRQKRIPRQIEVSFASVISKGKKSEKMKKLLTLSPPNIVKEAIKQKLAEDN
jgi:serine/threonine protein kinase